MPSVIQSLRNLSSAIQELPAQYHWVFADEALLRAISRGEPVARGIRGRRLCGLLKAGQFLGVLWPVLCVVGLAELARLLIQQWSSAGKTRPQRADYPARFFVGFGASAEEQLFNEYAEQYGGNVERLNQIDVRSFAVWHRVGLVAALGALRRSLRIARTAIAEMPEALLPWRIDFLTFAGMQLGYFSYMLAWFEMLKARTAAQVEEVSFLANDTAAFAVVAAGLPACYRQHGRIYYSIQPNFTQVQALTTDEAAYLRTALPDAHITVRPKPKLTLAPEEMTREILITSAFYRDHPRMSVIEPFFGWAGAMKVPVRVRPRPQENSTFWSVQAARGAATIERQDSSFEQALERLRPRMVVSLASTTLADALDRGVVPVLLYEEDDRDVGELVYPLARHCLSWPRDGEVMIRLLHDDEFYGTVLKQLRHGTDEIRL